MGRRFAPRPKISDFSLEANCSSRSARKSASTRLKRSSKEGWTGSPAAGKWLPATWAIPLPSEEWSSDRSSFTGRDCHQGKIPSNRNRLDKCRLSAIERDYEGETMANNQTRNPNENYFEYAVTAGPWKGLKARLLRPTVATPRLRGRRDKSRKGLARTVSNRAWTHEIHWPPRLLKISLDIGVE